jgi:hypothetical protein
MYIFPLQGTVLEAEFLITSSSTFTQQIVVEAARGRSIGHKQRSSVGQDDSSTGRNEGFVARSEKGCNGQGDSSIGPKERSIGQEERSF